MSYILRLYDALLARGFPEFAAPRRSLWNWIKRHQIPSAAGDGALFAQSSRITTRPPIAPLGRL